MARVVARDLLRLAAVEIADLQDAILPQLVEIDWMGEVVDVASPEGVLAAGFLADYPVGIDKGHTRSVATTWHAEGASGVVARSASLMRAGFRDWDGDHENWSETAVYVNNAPRHPTLIQRRTDLDWLLPASPGT